VALDIFDELVTYLILFFPVPQASQLQSTMMETMEAVELEKQKHNNTRMEILTRLAKLEVC
jgi:hypothetical protein